jgi:hypothetical protein
LLAQMSSRGNLLNPNYTDEVVAKGSTHPGVFGFIGNGSRPEELAELRSKVGKSKMIWTPGVNLVTGDGEMGQRMEIRAKRFLLVRIVSLLEVVFTVQKTLLKQHSVTLRLHGMLWLREDYEFCTCWMGCRHPDYICNYESCVVHVEQ